MEDWNKFWQNLAHQKTPGRKAPAWGNLEPEFSQTNIAKKRSAGWLKLMARGQRDMRSYITTEFVDCLNAVAQRLSIPTRSHEELVRMFDVFQTSVVAEISTDIRVGVGHCIWAAPFVWAADRGWLDGGLNVPKILIATCGGPGKQAEPHYISSSKAVGSGQKALVGAIVNPFDISPRPASIEAPLASKPWSAVEILERLEDDTFHFAAVPSLVIQSRKDLDIVARVVDSTSGCVLALTLGSREIPGNSPVAKRLRSSFKDHGLTSLGTDSLCELLADLRDCLKTQFCSFASRLVMSAIMAM